MTQVWTWDELLVAFRTLGGTADNIVPGVGALGRGLFPIDRGESVRLHVPHNLLIAANDLDVIDDRMVVAKSAKVAQPEREFLEQYQQGFSWSGGGRAETASFVDSLDALPAVVRTLLAAEFAMGLTFQGSREERIRRRFLRSRMIERDGQFRVMPMMELVNHGPSSSPYVLENGVSLEGHFADEVLVNYGLVDPFGAFRNWGFASPEDQAFSLPMSLDIGARRLVIEAKPSLNARLGQVNVPQMKFEGNSLTLSWVMIGNKKVPRFSKGVFYRLMRDIGHENAELTFDFILHANRMQFLKLFAILEPFEGGLISTLRTMVRYQFTAMSHCVGMSEL